jgi:hypothetical protein
LRCDDSSTPTRRSHATTAAILGLDLGKFKNLVQPCAADYTADRIAVVRTDPATQGGEPGSLPSLG